MLQGLCKGSIEGSFHDSLVCSYSQVPTPLRLRYGVWGLGFRA